VQNDDIDTQMKIYRPATTTARTRQFNHPMSNGMAVLSREDTTPQSFTDAHCSNAMQ